MELCGERAGRRVELVDSAPGLATELLDVEDALDRV